MSVVVGVDSSVHEKGLGFPSVALVSATESALDEVSRWAHHSALAFGFWSDLERDVSSLVSQTAQAFHRLANLHQTFLALVEESVPDEVSWWALLSVQVSPSVWDLKRKG